MALVNGRAGGVFAASDERLTLFASRGIDPHVLDAVETLWRRAKDQLLQGRPLHVPDVSADRDLTGVAAGRGPQSVTVFPVFDEERLVALLYVDTLDAGRCDLEDVERLTKFSRILAHAVRPGAERARERAGWESYVETTRVEDFEREKLLLLLDRNAWNIARVARLMGVTRRTVYLRLRRYNIPRQRVPRRRLRVAPA